MSTPRGWVLDKTSNDWPLWIDHPTAWVTWLNAIAGDHTPLAPGHLDTLPQAGFAGDNWHFATFAKRGEPVGVIELAIESNKKEAFYALIGALNWESPEIAKGTGELAGRCFLASMGSVSSTDFLTEAGLELIRHGAMPPWRKLAQHLVSCSLPDRLLKEIDELLVKPEIPGEQNHQLPLPIALILDSRMGEGRHDVFRIWAREDLESLCLSHFVEGRPAGGGVLHACIWGGERSILSFLLRRQSFALMTSVDDKGRTPLRLAIELGSDSCENDLRTYNGRQIADEVLRHI